MENPDLVPLLEQLDDDIDDLEEVLAPLLQYALSSTAGKLPLLDKAHLYVLVTYAIESILFSYLRLNEVNAKEHPVFRELTRVKHYIEKLKVAESAGIAPTAKLDKPAADRFIKHVLAGNQRRNANQAQQSSTIKAAAHIRFEGVDEKVKIDDDELAMPKGDPSDDESESGNPNIFNSAKPTGSAVETSPDNDNTNTKVKKGRKRKSRSHSPEAVVNTSEPEGLSKQERKKRKKSRKKQKALEEARIG